MSVEVLVSLSSPRYFLARCEACGDVSYFDGEYYGSYENAQLATKQFTSNHSHSK